MSREILNALAKLDVQNDEHWTGDHLPRLDILKDLVGRVVTRAELSEVAKTFTRNNPTLEQAEVQTPAPEVPAAPVQSPVNSEQVQQQVTPIVTEEPSEPETELEWVQSKLEKARVEADEAAVAKTEADARYFEATNHVAALERRAQQLDPRSESEKLANTIAAYHQSQFEQQMAAALAAKGK